MKCEHQYLIIIWWYVLEKLNITFYWHNWLTDLVLGNGLKTIIISFKEVKNSITYSRFDNYWKLNFTS